MKHCHTLDNQTARRILRIACKAPPGVTLTGPSIISDGRY